MSQKRIDIIFKQSLLRSVTRLSILTSSFKRNSMHRFSPCFIDVNVMKHYFCKKNTVYVLRMEVGWNFGNFKRKGLDSKLICTSEALFLHPSGSILDEEVASSFVTSEYVSILPVLVSIIMYRQ